MGFFRLRVWGTKKPSENDHLTGHFQSFFFNISRTNSKTNKVNEQSVLNLLYVCVRACVRACACVCVCYL